MGIKNPSCLLTAMHNITMCTYEFRSHEHQQFLYASMINKFSKEMRVTFRRKKVCCFNKNVLGF